MSAAMATDPGVQEHFDGVLARDPAWVARAITLVESRLPEHRVQARALLAALLVHTGNSQRVGITGVPGVGKSTFIDQLGINLTSAGCRVAVLTVDPSSSRSGGSILGDKTRMERLAGDPHAFIRPSPAGGTLGGVTSATRESILVCEAAGFDVVLVETVGVGQSETIVADMVDFYCVLMLPGAGDDLQGIKKGVLELADLIAVNKADGDNITRAEQAAADYRLALHMTTPASPNWTPPVLTCSALTNVGLDELWAQVELHRVKLSESGELVQKRRDQQVRWMWSMLDDRLREDLRSHPAVVASLARVQAQVEQGLITPTAAADEIWERYSGS